MRAALYARISTLNHGQNAEVQLRELREYCGRRGFEIAAEYVDSGVSGSKERRPQLDRLWIDAKRRKFDCVVVYRYDRFARSLRQLVNALEEFRGLGIVGNLWRATATILDTWSGKRPRIVEVSPGRALVGHPPPVGARYVCGPTFLG